MDADMFKRILTAAVGGVVIFAIAACAIRLRGDQDKPAVPVIARPEKSLLASDLERCRGVTTEQDPAYAQCRKIWAENRRVFFGKSTTAVDQDDNAAKDQSRLPQGEVLAAPQQRGQP
jgi:conjugative transfer region protein TrbK